MVCGRRCQAQAHFERFVVVRFYAKARHPTVNHQIDVRAIRSLATGEWLGRVKQQSLQIIDDTLHQLKGDVARFGNIDVGRRLTQFHASDCGRFGQLLRRGMRSQTFLYTLHEMLLLQMAWRTWCSGIRIHYFLQHFLQQKTVSFDTNASTD